jgi:hypothetical protein
MFKISIGVSLEEEQTSEFQVVVSERVNKLQNLITSEKRKLKPPVITLRVSRLNELNNQKKPSTRALCE